MLLEGGKTAQCGYSPHIKVFNKTGEKNNYINKVTQS